MINKKNGDSQFENALNDCLESLLHGDASMESCLLRYPQYAAELKPLLEMLQASRVTNAITPDPAFRTRARYEFRRALYDSRPHRKQPALAWRWRWTTAVATLGVFLLTATGSVMAASSGSMPGQPLYQVKRAMENVQLDLAPSQAAKARLYASFADRRVSEIIYAAQLGDAELTEDLTMQFTQDLNMISAIAVPSRAATFGNGSKQGGASTENGMTTDSTTPATATLLPTTSTPPVATTGEPQPTLVLTQLPPVTVTQAAPVPTPSLTVTQPTYTIAQPSLSGIDDPALLKLLQQYSVKNVSELMSILDKVPPSVKTALLAAIQAATSGYGQLLGS